MANKILIKRNTSSGRDPAANELSIGELALNTADQKLFFKHTNDTVHYIQSLYTSSIDELLDVDTTSTAPNNNQVLSWNALESKWIPRSVGDQITLTQLDQTAATLSTISNVNNLKFDNEFVLSDLGNGVAKLSLQSIAVDSNGDVTVTGDLEITGDLIVNGTSVGFGYTGSRGETGFTGSLGYHGSQGYTGSEGESSFSWGSEPPQNPEIGDRWFDTVKGAMTVYVDDGTSLQWVEISASGFIGQQGYTGSKGDPDGYTGSRGDVGYTGSQGDIGYTGSTGAGYTGSQGDVGFTGSQGDIGYTGSQGDTGYTGSRGDLGYAGSQGNIGYSGSRGAPGYTGSRGDIGYTGSQGDTGYTGSYGDLGYTGSQGDIGFTGSQGNIGYTGSQGDIGYTGSQGDIGYTGSQGDMGFTGSQGDIGFTGSQGDIGYSGSQGDIGFTGSQGNIGYSGSQGDIGFTGSQGNIGYSGSQGDIGFTGSQGDIGFTGSQGDAGYTGSKGDIGDLNNISGVSESYVVFNSSNGTISHDVTVSNNFLHDQPSGDFIVNFTNVPNTDLRTRVITLIILQGSTARMPTGVQIDGQSQTINWINGESPSGTDNEINLISFVLIRRSTTWYILGQSSLFA